MGAAPVSVPTGSLRAAGGLRVLVAAPGLGVILVEDLPPAKMSLQLRSGRDPAPPRLAGVGKGLVPGGTQGPGPCPDGDPVGLCLTPRVRGVTQCHGELGCSSVVPHGQCRGGLSGGRCHHPWVPPVCRDSWQGSADITAVLREKKPPQYDPDTKNVVSPTSESQDIPQGPSPRDPPPPSLPLPLVPRLNWHLSQGLGGTEPSCPPGMLLNPLPSPDIQLRHPRCTAQGSRTLKLGGTKDASELIPPARAGKIIALCSLQEAQRPLVPF